MISLRALNPTGADRDALTAFLTHNTFPFHARARTTPEQAIEAIDSGAYDDDDHRSFWVEDNGKRVGFARLEDLSDPTPLFDLRLGESHRGRGLGSQALRALTAHVFNAMPSVNRFEGQTREDNIAMRRAFLRQGWLKEAHYRESWPVEGATPLASIAYAILRRDWQSGHTTTFTWEDLTL